MSGGYAFDLASFRRVGAATRWAEQQMGTMPNDFENSPLSPQEAWVKTPDTLPAGYNGSLAIQGASYFRTPSGTNQKIADCWIKEINGGRLVAGKMYRGLFGGTLEQILYSGSSTTLSLPNFWVQGPAVAAESHFYPSQVTLDNSQAFWIPGDIGPYYIISQNPPSVIKMFGAGVISKIVRTSSNIIGSVNPILKIKNSNSKITYNNVDYLVYDWYSDPIWIVDPIKIVNGTPVDFNGTPYGVQAIDPLSLATFTTGQFMCQWQIGQAGYKYSQGSYDQIFVVSQKPASTGGASIGPVMGA